LRPRVGAETVVVTAGFVSAGAATVAGSAGVALAVGAAGATVQVLHAVPHELHPRRMAACESLALTANRTTAIATTLRTCMRIKSSSYLKKQKLPSADDALPRGSS
jgi:hypothetical protein